MKRKDTRHVQLERDFGQVLMRVCWPAKPNSKVPLINITSPHLRTSPPSSDPRSSPPNLPLHIPNTHLPARFLIIVKPLPLLQINPPKVRSRLEPFRHPLALRAHHQQRPSQQRA